MHSFRNHKKFSVISEMHVFSFAVAIYRLNILLEAKAGIEKIQVSKVCCATISLGENSLFFDIP